MWLPPRSLSTRLDGECGPRSISDPQQMLPLAKFALKANSFGYPEGRDHAPFDLLASLACAFAD